jgi:hypothetical protein
MLLSRSGQLGRVVFLGVRTSKTKPDLVEKKNCCD